MRRLIFCTALSVVFIMMPWVATSTKIDRIPVEFNYKTEARYVLYKTEVRYVLHKTETRYVLEELTIYNPVQSQCDDTPLITASNATIDLNKLLRKELYWMALSRDLLKRWKGKFQYGDTVLVTSGDAAIDGLWIVQDTMNKRFKNRGDLLFDSTVRKSGKWQNVEISKIKMVKTLIETPIN